MIEKITDQNLERYDSRLKEWCDRKFFEKGNYGKYQTTEEAGAVAFYPAPNTLLESKVKFSFKETMPINGDKGPDNPSTITGVSSIKMSYAGKNCADIRLAAYIDSGLQFTKNSDGTFRVYGNIPNDTGHPFINIYHNSFGDVIDRIKPGVTYTASFNCTDSNAILQLLSHSNDNYIKLFEIKNGDHSTFTMPNDSDDTCWLRLILPRGEVDCLCSIQIEVGELATNFELPAIRNIYTIQLGDIYYGGSLDITTGVMTVTHTMYDIGEVVTNYSISNAVFYFDSSIASMVTSPICESFVFNQASLPSLANGEFRYQLDSSIPQGSIRWLFRATGYSDVESFSTAFAGKKLVYQLATPLTVQLTPTQILSLAQPDKYTPKLNTVYTDADSVQISYLKSSIRDEYEKTQAILSLGGNS